jgi:hypothetical protein
MCASGTMSVNPLVQSSKMSSSARRKCSALTLSPSPPALIAPVRMCSRPSAPAPPVSAAVSQRGPHAASGRASTG